MANKKFWSGILILALVLGTAVIGCDNGTTGNGTPGGVVGGPADITYTVAANGELDKKTSTQLTFTFTEAVKDLTVDNIKISVGSGTAKIDTSKPADQVLKGGETSWTLSVTNITAGTIRVEIIDQNDIKLGIERGRKTLIVHQNTASASSKAQAIELPPDADWEISSINEGEEKWYKFEVEAGTDYYVQWSNNNSSEYTGSINVTAYKSDDTQIFYGYPWTEPQLISAVSGTVYLKVQVASSYTSKPGTFAIRFYDPAAMYPVNAVNMGILEILFDGSVMVRWGVPGGDPNALRLSGYRVYRSETEDVGYTMLIDIPDTSVFTYNDTEVDGGKTYWYKVAAYNSKGEGEPTNPNKIKIPEDVGILLTVGGDYFEGEFFSNISDEDGEIITEGKSYEWYNFTAEAGKTYEVQWLGSGDGYQAMLFVTAFKDDNTEIARSDWQGKTLAISGVSGKVFIKAQQSFLAGTYAIRVVQQ
jgi:hypothetical protein